MRRRVTTVLLLGFLVGEWALHGAPLPASSGTGPWQAFGKGTYRVLAAAGQDSLVGAEGKGVLWQVNVDGRRVRLEPNRQGPVFSRSERLVGVHLAGREIFLLSTRSGFWPVSGSPGARRVVFRDPGGGLYLGDVRTLIASPLTDRVLPAPTPIPGESAAPVWVDQSRLLLVSGSGSPGVWKLDLADSTLQLLWNGRTYGQIWPLGMLRGDLLLGTGTGVLVAVSPTGHIMRFGVGMLPLGRSGMELAYAPAAGQGPPSRVEVLDLATGVSTPVPLPHGSHPVGGVSFSPAGDRLALLAKGPGQNPVLLLARSQNGRWQTTSYRPPTDAGQLARRTPAFLSGGRVLVATVRQGKTLSFVLTPPS